MDTLRRTWRHAALLLVLLALPFATPSQAQTFFPDDPLAEDPDRMDIERPASDGVSDAFDFIEQTLGLNADYDGPALNANTLGEVPRSSWYTPRHYHDRMSPEALARGPGPALEPAFPWTILSLKREGKTPGFVVRDARGDRFVVKMDPPGHLGLTSGAEAISTRIMHALGYHVPDNNVVDFRLDDLRIREGVTYVRNGRERPLTPEALAEIFGAVPRTPEGRLRALASRFVEGDILGPFRYAGTRPDDPNDLYPHEARRELRGMRVAAAWINHTDARAQNTLDTYVEHDGARYVRHYLIDFGTTLGGGPFGPKPEQRGHEYLFEPVPIALRTVTFGIAAAGWMDVDYPDDPAVGHFEADVFEPEEWKSQYPNPAFIRMDADDAFWMARQVMAFTDADLEAIVAVARYPRAETARTIVETLARRRDKIGRAWLRHGGGLDRFRVEHGRLHFADLPARHGIRPAPSARSVRWYGFDNATGRLTEAIGGRFDADGPGVAVPDAPGAFVAAVFDTPGEGTTRVVLRRSGAGWEVVGIERE